VPSDHSGSVRRGPPGASVVVGGIRIAAALDPGDEYPPVVPPERHRESERADTYLPVRATGERFTVLGRLTPRGGDDLVEFVEDPVLFVG